MSINFAEMREKAKNASTDELREMLAQALDALAQQAFQGLADKITLPNLLPVPQPIVIPIIHPVVVPQPGLLPWWQRYEYTQQPFTITCSTSAA